jgi:hypothetical protein
MPFQALGHDSHFCFSIAWFGSSHAGEGTAPAPEAVTNIGPVLAKTYRNPFTLLSRHLWLDEGNGWVLFLMFDKPVTGHRARGDSATHISNRFCE